MSRNVSHFQTLKKKTLYVLSNTHECMIQLLKLIQHVKVEKTGQTTLSVGSWSVVSRLLVGCQWVVGK